MLKRVLTIREQKLEPGHPDTISSLNNLAKLYVKQKKYRQVMPLLGRIEALQEPLSTKQRTEQPIEDVSEFEQIELEQMSVGKIICIYNGHVDIKPERDPDYPNSAPNLKFSPDSQFVASAFSDCDLFCDFATERPEMYALHIWQASTGKRISSRIDTTVGFSWSPNSKYIAGRSTTESIINVWNVTTGDFLFSYSGHSWLPTSIQWSPDGSRIASACAFYRADGAIHVWDTNKGDQLLVYYPQAGGISHLAWSPDSTRIASVHEVKFEHQILLISDAASGQKLLTYDCGVV